MSVIEAVERDLEVLGGDARGSGLAAAALALAAELDGANSATSKSMCAKALVDVLREIRSLAPLPRETDELSDLRERREKRIAGLAASGPAASS